MNISEYIKHLEHLKEVHGDIEVRQGSFMDYRVAPPPKFAQLASLRPRETKARILYSWDKDRKPIKDIVVL